MKQLTDPVLPGQTMKPRRRVSDIFRRPGNEPPLLTEKLPEFLRGVTVNVKKKLLTTVVGALLVAANEWLGLGIPEETLDRIVVLLVGFIVGQGLADFGKERAKVEMGIKILILSFLLAGTASLAQA